MNELLVNILYPVLSAGLIALFTWLILRTKLSKGYRKATFHLRRGEALQEAKQFNEALEEIEKSVKILEDEPRHKLLSEAYLHLGDIDCKIGKFESAIIHYTLCQSSSKMVKDGISEDVIKLKLGHAYQCAGKSDDAFRCIDKARNIQEKIENHPMLAETYSKLGEIESSRGYIGVAIEHFLRALNYQEKIRDRRSQAATRTFLGDLHLKGENQKEALNHYRAALELYREVGDTAIANLVESKVNEIGI